jgi:hypothetical protein
MPCASKTAPRPSTTTWWGPAAEVEGRPAVEAEADRPAHCPYHPDDLVTRPGLARAVDRHEVHDLADALVAEKARHQDVAVRHVHLFVLRRVYARDAERAPFPVVEDRREDARRVKVRHAAPVDGPVDADQGNGVQVADDPVRLDRLVAHDFVSSTRSTLIERHDGRNVNTWAMVWVLTQRLNSSCRRSMAFEVRIDFNWLGRKRVKVNSLSPASPTSVSAFGFARTHPRRPLDDHHRTEAEEDPAVSLIRRSGSTTAPSPMPRRAPNASPTRQRSTRI